MLPIHQRPEHCVAANILQAQIDKIIPVGLSKKVEFTDLHRHVAINSMEEFASQQQGGYSERQMKPHEVLDDHMANLPDEELTDAQYSAVTAAIKFFHDQFASQSLRWVEVKSLDDLPEGWNHYQVFNMQFPEKLLNFYSAKQKDIIDYGYYTDNEGAIELFKDKSHLQTLRYLSEPPANTEHLPS